MGGFLGPLKALKLVGLEAPWHGQRHGQAGRRLVGLWHLLPRTIDRECAAWEQHPEGRQAKARAAAQHLRRV